MTVFALPAAGGIAPVRPASEWLAPNHDLSSTRAAGGSQLRAGNVDRLRVAWRFPLTNRADYAGVITSTPLVVGDTVYVQDMGSNVHALDRETGALRWTKRFGAPNPGPNGLAIESGTVFGNTDTRAFALDRETGKLLWSRRLITPTEQFVDIAPVVANGLVYTSTIGYPPGGRGALYALDADTGEIRWRFDTILGPWRYPKEAGGGGAWYPMSVDEHGRVYAGIANPAPWGGTGKRPNGGSFPGPALYTDSLLVLDGQTGELLWYDQVTPHDIRDYDFQLSPILATLPVLGVERDVVIGGGKAGLVIAWDRDTGERLWTATLGKRKNDVGPLPRRRVTVCPGLLGGVETPMALAEQRVFVPVVNFCAKGSSIGYEPLTGLDPAEGTGELVAIDTRTGIPLWSTRFPSALFGCATVANDVVVAPSYDGRITALAATDGSIVWQARARAGINACPAISGDMLFIGAGADHPAFPRPVREVIAFRLAGERS